MTQHGNQPIDREYPKKALRVGLSREKLAEAMKSDIEAHNAYVEEHGLFADLLRQTPSSKQD